MGKPVLFMTNVIWRTCCDHGNSSSPYTWYRCPCFWEICFRNTIPLLVIINTSLSL